MMYLAIIRELDHFIVENIRTARRFLIKCGYEKPIDSIRFFELNKHTPDEDKAGFLNPCLKVFQWVLFRKQGYRG